MNYCWIAFLCGIFLGGGIGVVTMCLMFVAKESDEAMSGEG